MLMMSEMSFSFSFNVMLSMSKIDQIHLRAVMLCMSKMSKMGNEHTHILVLDRSMSNVSDMSFSCSLNVMLSMLKMLKIGQIHLVVIMLCSICQRHRRCKKKIHTHFCSYLP